MIRKLRSLAAMVSSCVFCAACYAQGAEFEYKSGSYKIQLTHTAPFVTYLSVDSLGKGEVARNTIQWKPRADAGTYELREVSDSQAEIWRKGDASGPVWVFSFAEKQFTVTSNRKDDKGSAIDFRFGKVQVHATLLGLMAGRNKTRLPTQVAQPTDRT